MIQSTQFYDPVKTDCNLPSPKILSEKELENAIASLNATEIEGIATTLVAFVMERLGIDVKETDTIGGIVKPQPNSIGTGQTYVYAQKFDPNSKLMKLLLPAFIDRITKDFSVPGEFAQNGITFDFLNEEKNGLLDQVENEVL